MNKKMQNKKDAAYDLADKVWDATMQLEEVCRDLNLQGVVNKELLAISAAVLEIKNKVMFNVKG